MQVTPIGMLDPLKKPAHNDFAGMPGYTAAKRSVFVVNEEGKVTYEWIAPNPGVEPDYEAVSAAVK
jgi:peroxiredoxin